MKITTQLHASIDCPANEPSTYCCFPSNMTEYGYVHLGEVEIEIEPISGKDLVTRSVEILRKKQETIKQNAHNQVEALQERINSMLCLEYKGDEQ